MKKFIYNYTSGQQSGIELTSLSPGPGAHECNCKCGNDSKSCRKDKGSHQ